MEKKKVQVKLLRGKLEEVKKMFFFLLSKTTKHWNLPKTIKHWNLP
jgi:hypothetical protein